MELDTWVGAWVPAGTPADVMARLKSALAAALAKPAVQQKFTNMNAEAKFIDTPEFAKLLADEGRLLSALIKDRKIAAE